jgi:protoheme ferro-lyase
VDAPLSQSKDRRIDALGETAREAIALLARPPDQIIMSFHGLPQRFIDRGDRTCRIEQLQGWT